MSTDQPPPGQGSGPDDDPFRKRPAGPPPGEPSQGPPPSGASSGAPPPPPPGPGEPYGTYGPPGGYGAHGYGGPDPALAGMPPLAGSGRRLLARIVDALVVGIPVNVLLVLLGILTWSTDGDGFSRGNNLAGSAIYAFVYFVYEGLLLSATGRTLGKKWLGIRVAMLDSGAVPSGSPGWIRAFVYGVCGWLCCLWPVNVLWHLFDRPYRQCLHDKAARTVVVVDR